MSVQTSTLANGLRIVSHHMPHLETVSLGVWVGAGARDESRQQHGISHMLEHMAFKGTGRRSAQQIAEEIESAGGDLNAATSLDRTAYYARVLKGDVGLALDILSDILRNPSFDEAELAREKDVILQEIAAARDDPSDLAYDLLQSTAFPDQALGRAILGTPESVSAITPDDLRGYLDSHYCANRFVLGAAGAIEHDFLVSQAEALFGDLPAQAENDFEAARYEGGTRSASKPFEQSHIVMAFPGPSYLEKEIYTAQVFSGLFGGGMSSRLFQQVRERRGLCYDIYSFCWGLSDAGLFGLHAATSERKVPELLEVVTGELRRAAEEGVSDAELARSKAQLKAGLLMSLESSGARAEQLARQVLAFGRPFAVEELVGYVEDVSLDMVQGLCAAARCDSGA